MCFVMCAPEYSTLGQPLDFIVLKLSCWSIHRMVSDRLLYRGNPIVYGRTTVLNRIDVMNTKRARNSLQFISPTKFNDCVNVSCAMSSNLQMDLLRDLKRYYSFAKSWNWRCEFYVVKNLKNALNMHKSAI